MTPPGTDSRETIAMLHRYYEGCNTGNVVLMTGTFTDDVVHYFLEPGTQEVRGAEHLARYWRKVQRLLDARWEIDHAIAQCDEAVIEWTIYWTNPQTRQRLTTRGTEWFVFRQGRIAEVRAYYNQRRDADSGLVGFDYVGRGYTHGL